MTYYYCSYCGTDYGNFPQVYIMLNSQVQSDWEKRNDNLFENKFSEIVKEIAKEKGIRVNYVLDRHIGEVYKKYEDWLFNTQRGSFCSVDCAIKGIKERAKETRVIVDEKYKGTVVPDYYGNNISIGDTVLTSDSDDWDTEAKVLQIIEVYSDFIVITDHTNVPSKTVKLKGG